MLFSNINVYLLVNLPICPIKIYLLYMKYLPIFLMKNILLLYEYFRMKFFNQYYTHININTHASSIVINHLHATKIIIIFNFKIVFILMKG